MRYLFSQKNHSTGETFKVFGAGQQALIVPSFKGVDVDTMQENDSFLGKGTFKRVTWGLYREGGGKPFEWVAVAKIRRESGLSQNALQQKKSKKFSSISDENHAEELRIGRALQPSSCCVLGDIQTDKAFRTLLLPALGDLRELLKEISTHKTFQERKQIFDWFVKKLIRLCYEIQTKYEQQQQVFAHGDLKLENILMLPDGDLVLSDFNDSYLGEPDLVWPVNNFGAYPKSTRLYDAPESSTTKHAIPESDVWSVGCCAYEAIKLLFPESSLSKLRSPFDFRQPKVGTYSESYYKESMPCRVIAYDLLQDFFLQHSGHLEQMFSEHQTYPQELIKQSETRIIKHLNFLDLALTGHRQSIMPWAIQDLFEYFKNLYAFDANLFRLLVFEIGYSQYSKRKTFKQLHDIISAYPLPDTMPDFLRSWIADKKTHMQEHRPRGLSDVILDYDAITAAHLASQNTATDSGVASAAVKPFSCQIS